jgi:hypothetical protein
MSMRAKAEQKTAAVEQKRRVSEAKVKSLLGMHSCSPPPPPPAPPSLSAASSPCPSSSSSVHHSHTAPASADYFDHHSGDDGDGDWDGDAHGQGQGSVCPLEMRYGLGVQRPLAAFEAMSGVCFGTLTVVAPRLQEGWCLCEGELSGLFEALSMSGAGTESGQAEEQEQREGRGHEEERDTEGVGEGGAFRKSHVTGQMSSAALQAVDLVRSYL